MQIAKQLYIPNFKDIYDKESEVFKKFKIEAEFEPLKLEALDDSVEVDLVIILYYQRSMILDDPLVYQGKG